MTLVVSHLEDLQRARAIAARITEQDPVRAHLAFWEGINADPRAVAVFHVVAELGMTQLLAERPERES